MAVEDDMYLENLQEFVLDENKIVTYKWLSKTLSVHVNQAKQMLYSFASKQKKSKTPVCITYLISGIKNKDGVSVQTVAIVREDDFETAKSSLDKVNGVHVYSVQKSVLRDTDALYTTDYDITKESLQEANKFSSIKCSKARPRSQAEVEKLTSSSAPSGSSQAQSAVGRSKPAEKTTEVKGGESCTAPPKAAPKKSKAGIADMFSRAKTNKSKVKEEEKSGEASSGAAKVVKQKETASKPKGMAAFLSKPTKRTESAPASKKDAPAEKEKKEKVKIEKKTVASKKRQSPITVIPDSDDEIDERPVKKRRRRVREMSDSSSDEEMSVDSPAPEPPSPPPSPSPPQSPEKESTPPPEEKASHDAGSSGHRRRRKRVMKSRQFTDEEGCMVTEKVYVSESTDASDEEEKTSKKMEQPKKSNVKDAKKESPPAKKKKSPVKTKQPSLMSFFKKK